MYSWSIAAGKSSGQVPCVLLRPFRTNSSYRFGSSGDLYARAPYMENQAANIVAQICAAISHMHKNGVVHRDLKVEK